MGFNGIYPLVKHTKSIKKLLNMAIYRFIVDFPMKTSDFPLPLQHVSLPEGIFHQNWGDPLVWQLATSKVGRQLIGFVKELTSGTEEAIGWWRWMEMEGGKMKGEEYGHVWKWGIPPMK